MTNKYLLMASALWLGTTVGLQAQDTVAWDWTTTIDISEGATSCEDGQLIPTNDGNCVGIFTTGGQSDIYAGSIVKMDMEGNTLWQQTIQAITSTTAQRVIEAENGKFYVAGTTLDGTVTKPYIATFEADGTPGDVIVMDEGNDRIMIGNFTALESGITFFATLRSDLTYSGKYIYKYFDFDLKEKASSSYAESGSISVPASVVANSQALVAVIAGGPYVDGQLITFAIDSSDAPTQRSGNYQSGAADTEDFYFTIKNSASYSVERCAYSGGYLNTKWTQSVDFDPNYYTPVVKPCDDGYVYLWHKSNYTHRVAKFSAENGAVAWSKDIVPGLEDTMIGDGFAYTLGVAENGDFVAGGHTGDFKVFWYRLAADNGTYVSSIADIVNEEYDYAYTFDEMSSFADDTFYFAGFLRTGASNGGNTPFFATYDINNPAEHLWCSMPECGYLPADYPGSGVINEDGSAYVAMTISSQPALGKYDANGRLLWYAKSGIWGQARYVNVNADGTITLVGSSESESYSDYPTFVSTFSADGALIDTKVLDVKAYYSTLLTATWIGDEIVIVTSGYDEMWNRAILIEKVAADGSCSSELVPSTQNIAPYDAKVDQNGDILIFGYCYDSEWMLHPCVMKTKIDGSLIYETSIDSVTDGEIYDAWSDTQGRTYAVGYASKSYAYYALLSAEGEVIDEKQTDSLGFYESVGGIDDSPFIVGTVTPDGSTSIVGRVTALKAGEMEEVWTTDIASSSLYTYALEMAFAEDGILVAGYETNGTTVAEMIANLSLDGEILGKSVGETIPNNNQNYFISGFVTEGNKALLLSARSVANLVYVGYASMYTIGKTPDSVQSISTSAEVISTNYIDMQGRPVTGDCRGLYIRRQVMSDGSVRCTKVHK